MSNNNELSKLIGQLSETGPGSLSLSRFIQPLMVSGPSSSTASGSLNAASQGTKSLSTNEKFESIQFGKPSNDNTSVSQSGSLWESLLSQSTSGGLSSALSGGFGSIAGLGGLISGIASLFGGSSKSAPTPLALFSLPNSVQQTAYVSSKGTSVYSGDVTDQSVNSTAGSAIYTTSGLSKNSSETAPAASIDSGTIAQAVKNALLTSNTLGDVIAEI